LKINKQQLILISSFLLGIALYVFAVQTTFTFRFANYDTLMIVLLTIIAGPAVLLLGYGTVVLIGGVASLRLAEFLARVTRSKHVIEIIDEKPQTLRQKIQTEYFTLIMPLLVFVLSMVIVWDVYNLHEDSTSIFHPLLHWLDVLSKPTGIGPITFAIDAIPAMITLIAISGITPAIVLPYFRKFKITGVNSGPFHTTLLTTVLGFVIGLGAILAIVGLVYETLWVGKEPRYYHYVIPAMLGLCIHYTIGAYLGREKSEKMITKTLEQQSRKRVVQGTVHIRGPHEN